ncbi:GTPase ObgE [Euzebya sp.]|uniref:GTPase ObgE n=1 Tax=Euzebya sp. TaxID=1971409 RepID=UPI003513E5F9
MFVDQVKINVRGGKGGDGVTSFRRQPYEPKGPPEGGDGGGGGDVLVVADHQLATLVDFHFRPHRKAGNGANGSGDLRHGARGDDEVLAVPVGTVVTDAETGEVIADLLVDGQEVVVAAGGRGGRGNAAFRTRQRRAPRFHEFGAAGEERWVTLELKLVADVALVGFPNGGKSSLISRLSAAKPKIADYPFTTLQPNLGVVTADDLDFVVADVPGLIEGAAEGRGLGHEFLRHVERAGALVHVLDCASGYAAADDDHPTRRYEQRNPAEDLEVVLAELRAYESDLVDRPAIVWLNKVDADPDMAALIRPELEEAGWEVLSGSAVTGEGVEALRWRLADLVRQARAERRDPDHPQPTARPVLRPRQQRSGPDFSVVKVGLGGGEVGWRVVGDRIERWVTQLDLGNVDAVAYLQGRLQRAGVEAALAEAGAQPGEDVEIAGTVFTFKPEEWDVADDADLDAGWDDDEEVDVTVPDGPVEIDVPAADDPPADDDPGSRRP